MTKKRKKIISKVIASGMLISNIPIQTFANEIEDILVDTSNVEENISQEEINNSEILDIGDKAEIIDSSELENENTISEDGNLSNSQLTEENLKIEDSESLRAEDIEQSIITKEVVDNKYIINSLDDLKQLRTEINTNNLDTTGMIIELGADIDFAGETSWESIGTDLNQFQGVFDGKNYTIKNLNITGEFNGLFNYTNNATFMNINFSNFNINSQSSQVGIVVGIANNSITATNLNFENISLIATNASYVGGIAGLIPNAISSISQISFSGSIYNEKGYVGGISGMASGNFSEIEITGKISGGSYIGGITGLLVGPSKSVSKIENIDINASIEGIGAGSNYVGGIIGMAPSALSINSVNISGEYIGSKTNNSYVGGIIAQFVDSSSVQENSILECTINTKEISGVSVGGIFGFLSCYTNLNIENNRIYSNISGIEGTTFGRGSGGIGAYNTSIVSIRNNEIMSQDIDGYDYVAGVLGYSTGKTLLENNIVESNITSSKNASGIVTEIYASNANILNNSFKGKIKNTSTTGRTAGLSTYWVASDSNILGNKIEADIISQTNETGGLIGGLYASSNLKIENNTIKGTIEGKNLVGGLLGMGQNSNNTKIKNNDINITIIADDKVGGLGGSIINGEVENNKIISNITANDKVGGIVGETMNPSTIYSKNIISTNIIANDKVGGILGSGYPVQINNNFIEGNISAKSRIGGLMGCMSGIDTSFSIVKDSVIALNINGETLTNILTGELTGPIEIENVYYNTDLTELREDYGIGLTTTQMQGKEAQDNMNLDYTNIWKLNKEFYPTFEQLNSAPDIIPNDKVVDSTITINQYDKFNPLDYVIIEDFEGDEVTVSIKNTKEVFDTSKYGVFPITIVATDSKGLSSELTLNLKINPLMISLNNAPVIVAEDKVLTVGDEFNPLKMVVAYDKEDGIITDNIKIIENTVDMNKAGVYKVIYEVVDKDGAKTTKTITVTVKEKVVSNNNQSNNENNPNTNNDNKDTNVNTTEKPQTNDIGFVGLFGVLISSMSMYILNRKKED